VTSSSTVCRDLGTGHLDHPGGRGTPPSTQPAWSAPASSRGGSNIVVKNSTIKVKDGVLPSDYGPPRHLVMESAPWMHQHRWRNVRATNLLGTDTRAS